MPSIDIARATVGLSSSGVVIDDHEAPFVVTLHVSGAQIEKLTLTARNGASLPLQAQRKFLADLPLRDMLRVGAALTADETAPNETYYRQLVAVQDRDWAVLAVASWAVAVRRPGGASGAIAEFWAVSQRTAFRWLARAREKAPAPSGQPNGDRPRERRRD